MITKKALKNYLNTGATLDRNGDAVSLSGYQVSFFDGPQVPQNDLNAVLQAVDYSAFNIADRISEKLAENQEEVL